MKRKKKSTTYKWCAYWDGTSFVSGLNDGSIDSFDSVGKLVKVAC